MISRGGTERRKVITEVVMHTDWLTNAITSSGCHGRMEAACTHLLIPTVCEISMSSYSPCFFFRSSKYKFAFQKQNLNQKTSRIVMCFDKNSS